MAKKVETAEVLFRNRMEREGKKKQFEQVERDWVRKHGLIQAEATKKAMRHFGYEDPEIERALAEQWEETVEFEGSRELNGVEKACNGLPISANPAVELDWVRVHPAIRRWHMDPDKTKNFVITPEDVRNKQVGTAPSLGAVNMLMGALNAPQKFFDKLLDEHKKRVDNEQGNTATRADLGLEEVSNYLKQLKSRNKGKA